MSELLQALIQDKLRERSSQRAFDREAELRRSIAEADSIAASQLADRKREHDAKVATTEDERARAQATLEADLARGRDVSQYNANTGEWSPIGPSRLSKVPQLFQEPEFDAFGEITQFPDYDIVSGLLPGNTAYGAGEGPLMKTLEGLYNPRPDSGFTDIDFDEFSKFDPALARQFKNNVDRDGNVRVPISLLDTTQTAKHRKPSTPSANTKLLSVPDQKTIRSMTTQDLGGSSVRKEMTPQDVRKIPAGDLTQSDILVDAGLLGSVDAAIALELLDRLTSDDAAVRETAVFSAVMEDMRNGLHGGLMQALTSSDFVSIGAGMGIDRERGRNGEWEFDGVSLTDAISDPKKSEKWDNEIAEEVAAGRSEQEFALMLEIAGLSDNNIKKQLTRFGQYKNADAARINEDATEFGNTSFPGSGSPQQDAFQANTFRNIEAMFGGQ
jgi:hypothetical protein